VHSRHPFPPIGDVAYRQRAGGGSSHRHRQQAKNWGKDRACGSGDILAHRQTDTQTDILITLLGNHAWTVDGRCAAYWAMQLWRLRVTKGSRPEMWNWETSRLSITRPGNCFDARMMVQVGWRQTDGVLSSFPISGSRKDHTRWCRRKMSPGWRLGHGRNRISLIPPFTRPSNLRIFGAVLRSGFLALA